MRPTTRQIMDLIREIGLHPQMFALTPEDASAKVETLAAFAIAADSSHSFEVSYGEIVCKIIPEAVDDVVPVPSLRTQLCDEVAYPRVTSFAAVSRHTDKLLKILVAHGIGKSVPEQD